MLEHGKKVNTFTTHIVTSAKIIVALSPCGLHELTGKEELLARKIKEKNWKEINTYRFLVHS